MCKNLFISLLAFGLFLPTAIFSQGFKDKMKGKLAKDKSHIYECGYVYKPSLKDKMNIMKGLQKATAGAVTKDGMSDLGNIAVSVFYQAHLHPQEIMRFPTETPGWETCGDAVYVGMTNREGMGLASTDGKVSVDNKELPNAGFGTYFHGFKPEQRGAKTVNITSSDGDNIEVEVAPAAELAIKTIDGTPRGEAITIDGTRDVVIELENGDADPDSRLHVSLICRSMQTPIMYDVIVAKPSNRIVIPADAFYNFEGSPTPFSKENTLIVNRVKEEILEGTDAGAIRTLSCFMDWSPIKIEGDIVKGSIMTAGFKEDRNTQINLDMTTNGEYNFVIKKAGPYTSPPISLAKKVAVASFVVRGNLKDQETSTSSGSYVQVTTTMTKWFPEVSKASWQALADKLYTEFEQKLESEMGMEILPLEQVTSAEAYKHAKTIKDDVSQNFVEVGAGGTKRILTTSSADVFKDLSISFASDFVSERLIKELDVDAVVAITIDLDFDFETEGLDPKVNIQFFAPNVSHKTAAKYFSANASTKARSLEEAKEYSGGATNQLYQMIKGDIFLKELGQALEQMKKKEAEYPVYKNLWEAKL